MVNSSSSQHQQGSAFQQEHELQQQEHAQQQQPSIGWLLRLPPPLEQQFWQEGSVQGWVAQDTNAQPCAKEAAEVCLLLNLSSMARYSLSTWST